ncbi:HNH endonuclease signature motif containing protein [Brevibacterium yomogidense]|uniref:HNH endonuclease signature motif containing protein n=1 Tax=Brevibacterium yomogidense TaxID=946573 RepID=UPI0018DFD5D6|nr:HNH endonuclease signature motif containing protein [Brevibacterium yomogidense]
MRKQAAAESLTLIGNRHVDTVELVNGEDVYGHLIRGGSELTGTSAGRLAHFERQPGEVPAGEGWRMVDPALTHVPYATLTGSIDAFGLSARMREAAHALDRLSAVHMVAVAETALASIGKSDDPDTIDDVLCSHGFYSAREQVARVVPHGVVQAAAVDGDLTRNQAIRRVCEAVVAYVGLSNCLRAVLTGALSAAKIGVILRHSRGLRLHDVRWLDRTVGRLNPDMPVETFAREVGRMVELCAPPATRAKTVMDMRCVSYERLGNGMACVVLEGPITVLEPYMRRVDATARAIHSANLSGLVVKDHFGRPVDPAQVRITDTRSLEQIRFDLIALAAPGGRVWGTGDEDDGRMPLPADASPPAGASTSASASSSAAASRGLNGPPSGPNTATSGPVITVERRRMSRPSPVRGESVECDVVVDIPLQGPGVRPGTITDGTIRTDRQALAPGAWRNPLHPPQPAPPGALHYADDWTRTASAPSARHEPAGGDPPNSDPLDDATREADRGAPSDSTGDTPDEPAGGASDEPTRDPLEYFTVTCPTEGEWLAAQARVSLTVPVLTCADADSDLPSDLEGPVPVPAEMARRIVSAQSIVYRLLTDPASGEVLPEVATTYRVPAGMRRTVEERSKRCMVPGCLRPAARAQMDHIEPFNHASPADGGLTVVTNLHPLCVFHHQEKTAGIISVEVDDEGVENWSFPLGREAIAVLEPNFTDAEAAERLLEKLTEPPPTDKGVRSGEGGSSSRRRGRGVRRVGRGFRRVGRGFRRVGGCFDGIGCSAEERQR